LLLNNDPPKAWRPPEDGNHAAAAPAKHRASLKRGIRAAVACSSAVSPEKWLIFYAKRAQPSKGTTQTVFLGR